MLTLLMFGTDGLGKLDTSLKRHTALLVKFRSSLNQQAAVPALLKEISQLALEKYVEEAVGAIVDGLAKCKTAAEVAGAVEVSVRRAHGGVQSRSFIGSEC